MTLGVGDLASAAGAWLLVAGSLQQAAIELDEQDVDRVGLLDAKHTIAKPITATWWWLMPPVAIIRHLRDRRRYRQTVLTAMTAEQAGQWLRFSAKATAWLIVALGSLLLAAREARVLTTNAGWPVPVFWLLTVMSVLACALSTALARRRITTSTRSLVPEAEMVAGTRACDVAERASAPSRSPSDA